MSRRKAFNRWEYSSEDPEGLTLLEQFRQSEDWSMAPNLWGAVLWQALREARYTDRPESKHGWKRRAARRWIFHGGLDYRIVCHLAGVDAGGFQEGARRMGLHE